MNAANEAQMLANGFTKVPNSERLFVHDYYDGLLFRLCATAEEAAAGGGVFCFGSTVQVGYFGIDAIAVAREGKLGYLRMPNEVVHEPDQDPRRARWTITDPASYPPGPWGAKTTGFSMLLKVNKVGDVVGTSSSKPTFFCGMVSRADRGCFLRTTGSTHRAAIPVTHKFGVKVIEWHNAGRTVEELQTFGKSGPAGSIAPLIAFEYPDLSGYITYSWSVDKRGLLANTREHFLADLAKDADGKIVERYASAFDKLISVSTGSVVDGVTMRIRQSPSSGKFALTPSFGLPQRVSRGWSDVMAVALLRFTEKLEYAHSDKPSGNTGHLDITVEGNVSGPADVSGVPTVELAAVYVPAGSSDTSGTFNDLASSVYVGVPPFSLRYVPYTHVDMGHNRLIPVGNCIGFFSPRSGPGASEGSNGEKVVLDLSDRVGDELKRLAGDGYAGELVVLGTEEEQFAKVDAALDSENARRVAVTRALPYLSSYGRFIAESINFLDAEVVKN